jgi:hypothetical protein
VQDLDFLLRKAVRSGLNYLSLSPNHSNPKGDKWCAAYRHTENANCKYVEDDDPCEAIRKAIEAGEREARQSRMVRQTHDEHEAVVKAIQKKNIASVARKEEEKAQSRARRRRDMEDLL